MSSGSDGVADLGLANVLDPGDQVAHLAHAEALGGFGFRRDDAHLEQFVGGAGGHHLDFLARRERAVDHANVGHHTAVDVVDRIEDHRARRAVGVADGCGNQTDDLIEQFGDTGAGLARHPQDIAGFAADDVGEFAGVSVRIGRWQVDLVQDRDDREPTVQSKVEIGQGLRLDALRGVDQQHRPLTGLEGTGDLVGEVDVTGGVDQMQYVVGSVDRPGQPHVLGLDGDPAFPFDIHPVEILGAHVPVGNHSGQLQHSVGQRRLPVVDVSDDAEVPDLRRRGERPVGETADGNLLVSGTRSRFLNRPCGGFSVSTPGHPNPIATRRGVPLTAYAVDHDVAVEDVSATG